METVIIYWNATKYTKYTGINPIQFKIHDGYIRLDLTEGRSLLIPWTTINRIEIVEE